jgi:hypothetical protein
LFPISPEQAWLSRVRQLFWSVPTQGPPIDMANTLNGNPEPGGSPRVDDRTYTGSPHTSSTAFLCA